MLEGRGWLERFPHAGDGRVSRLELTGAGRQAEAAIALVRPHRVATLLDRVPAAQRKPLARALDSLVRATLKGKK